MIPTSDGRPLKVHIRRAADAMYRAEGKVNLSEIARRLGVGERIVTWHVARFRRFGAWPYRVDLGVGRRVWTEADRRLVRDIAATFNPRRRPLRSIVREFERETGRPIGRTTVQKILGGRP